jgi:hypothetical protein
MKDIITLVTSNAITLLFVNFFFYDIPKKINWAIYPHNIVSTVNLRLLTIPSR